MLKIETGRAKAAFSELKKRARTEDVAITKHGKVEAYLVSPERYDRFLAVSEAAPDSLKKLEDEYQRRFEQMQTPYAHKVLSEMKTKPLAEILAEGALADEQEKPAPQVRRPRGRRPAARR